MARPLTAGRLVVRLVVVVVLQLSLLFLPAGTWRWPAAWLYLGLYLSFAVPVMIWLFHRNPALLAERLDWTKRAPKRWDRALMAGLIPVFVALYVVAGLDFRFGWSRVPLAPRVVAFALMGGFYAVLTLVLRENTHLSRVVEVHPEAGHRVVTTGPYAVVRHPMYAGYVAWLFGVPVGLGSWPALIPGVVLAVAIVVRTVLEDRTLHVELPGYRDYAARVRFRLVPGLW